jgi:hypothetical protein
MSFWDLSVPAGILGAGASYYTHIPHLYSNLEQSVAVSCVPVVQAQMLRDSCDVLKYTTELLHAYAAVPAVLYEA